MASVLASKIFNCGARVLYRPVRSESYSEPWRAIAAVVHSGDTYASTTCCSLS